MITSDKYIEYLKIYDSVDFTEYEVNTIKNLTSYNVTFVEYNGIPSKSQIFIWKGITIHKLEDNWYLIFAFFNAEKYYRLDGFNELYLCLYKMLFG